MFCARASSLFIRTVTSAKAPIGLPSRIASRSFITNAKKSNNTKNANTKVLIACGAPKSLFSNKAVRASLRSTPINGIVILQHRNYTELSEHEKKEKAEEALRRLGRIATGLALWGGLTWVAFKLFHPAIFGIYCVGAGLYFLGKTASYGFTQYLKNRLANDVHLLPNLHDVLRKNGDVLRKSLGDFSMPEMEQIVSWRARAPNAPSTEPEFLHYTTYLRGDKSRAWLRARGYQEGDAWMLEKVLVDILTPEADQKLRKEEEEIEAGTFQRNPNEDRGEEDPKGYFMSETITLYDAKPESKIVDLDADQIQVIEKETREKIHQLQQENENQKQ